MYFNVNGEEGKGERYPTYSIFVTWLFILCQSTDILLFTEAV